MTTLAIVETIEVDQVVIDENRTIVEVLPNVSIGVQGPPGEVLPYDMLWAVSKTTLKAIVSASTDFSDFKTRIAAL